MNCREIEDRIQVLLDDRSPLDADPVVHAHVRECEDCRRMVGEFTLLFSGPADFLDFTKAATVSTGVGGSIQTPWMRVAKVVCAVAAIVVLFVQPAIWGWQHWHPRLAAVNSLASEFSEPNVGKTADTPGGFAVTAVDQAEDESAIDVASLLDFSDAISGIDLSGFNAANIPVVRPLAKPVNISWNQIMQSIPSFGQPAEMPSDQMRDMQMDSNQLQMLFNSWSRIFS